VERRKCASSPSSSLRLSESANLFSINKKWDAPVAVGLADKFLELLRQRRADGCDKWLMKSFERLLKPFQSFAEGLLDDYTAVKLSMMTHVSNGPVEGLNNRLKMLKRRMYGRARLELLSKRFILAQ
jgi:transposase